MKKHRTGYMCEIDFIHEIGEAMGGNSIHPSVKDLKENHPCVNSCGIVKVEVKLVKVIKDGNLDDGKTFKEIKEYEKSQKYFEHLKERVQHFSKITDNYKALKEKFKNGK